MSLKSDPILRVEKFKSISLDESFFDSLKTDYAEFENWFEKKGEQLAFTFRNDSGGLDGFLYLKEENAVVADVFPPLPLSSRIKIGTFKINSHGTRLGERFIKRAFDIAVSRKVQALYVTVFEKHQNLLSLFLRYGFIERATKSTANGVELVLEKVLKVTSGDVVLDYPLIPIIKDRHFVLSIYPQWHSRLLPDSLLNNENSSILQDVSHTNSIHKIYLTAMRGVDQLKRGDTLLIYRTSSGGPAFYTSVITSLCVVEELLNINVFTTIEKFIAYCSPYSVFSEAELRQFYTRKTYPWIVRFTYNLALGKRLTRGVLIEKVGLDPDIYWGFFQITSEQLESITKISGDHEKASSLIYSP